jgi:hypothetical protein
MEGGISINFNNDHTGTETKPSETDPSSTIQNDPSPKISDFLMTGTHCTMLVSAFLC